MSLSSTYLSRKQLIADNLQSMGVTSADASDGLTTLAGKILDIEPSISGLELDTNVTCTASESSVTVGGSVVFTAKLTASYDDTSVVDVDLSGVLTGATVSFYDGSTLLGAGVTDVNGVATYTHVFDSVGVFSVRSVFAGTENFDDCVSGSVGVVVDYNLSVSATKDIISYADSESTTVTALVSDDSGGVSGQSLSYSVVHDGVVLDSGSGVTDDDGLFSVVYQSRGVGDVSVIFSLRTSLQETYELEDCLKVYSQTYTSSTDLNYALPSTPFEIAYTLTRQNGVGYVRVGTNTNNCILFGMVGSDGSNGLARMDNGDYINLVQSSFIPTRNVPVDIKCQFDGNTYKYTVGTDTVSYNDVGQALTNLILVYCTNSNSIKNLRIKAL